MVPLPGPAPAPVVGFVTGVHGTEAHADLSSADAGVNADADADADTGIPGFSGIGAVGFPFRDCILSVRQRPPESRGGRDMAGWKATAAICRTESVPLNSLDYPRLDNDCWSWWVSVVFRGHPLRSGRTAGLHSTAHDLHPFWTAMSAFEQCHRDFLQYCYRALSSEPVGRLKSTRKQLRVQQQRTPFSSSGATRSKPSPSARRTRHVQAKSGGYPAVHGSFRMPPIDAVEISASQSTET